MMDARRYLCLPCLDEEDDMVADRLRQPFRLEVDFVTMPQCNRAARTAGVERTGPMTIVALGDTLWDQYRNLWAALRSALYEPASWLA